MDSTHRSWPDTDQWSIAGTAFWNTDQHLADQLGAQYEKHFIWHDLLKHRLNRFVNEKLGTAFWSTDQVKPADRNSARPSEASTELSVTNQSNSFALRLANIKSATWHGLLRHRSSRRFLIPCLAALSAKTDASSAFACLRQSNIIFSFLAVLSPKQHVRNEGIRAC